MADDKTPNDEQKELMKQAFKEAAKEFLQEIYMSFGKWSLRAIGAALVVMLIYLFLTMNGWQHIPNVANAVNQNGGQ